MDNQLALSVLLDVTATELEQVPQKEMSSSEKRAYALGILQSLFFSLMENTSIPIEQQQEHRRLYTAISKL